MGDFLSGALGTNSEVGVSNQNAYQAIQPYQQRGDQLMNILTGQAQGGGPNPAQMQYLQNAQQIAQQQAIMNAQNRALNPAAAARLSSQAGVSAGQQAAGNAAIQQAQQQLASQQLLGNVIGQQEHAVNQASGINAGVASGNQQQAGNIVGGIMGGAGAGLGAMKAHGGMVHSYADGGHVAPSPMSSVGQFLSKVGSIESGGMGAANPMQSGFTELGRGIGTQFKSPPPLVPTSSQTLPATSGMGMVAAHGGKVPALVSPGEKYFSPGEAKAVYEGRAGADDVGEKILGKASVKGDSYKNDTVRKNLDEGGIVIPRSIMNSDNPEKEAEKFIAKELSKHRKSPEGEFHEALRRAIAGRKNK